jgi:hypothetical protein
MRVPGMFSVLLSSFIFLSCASQPGGVLVIPLNANSKHQGKNYAEWSVEWWKWALSQQVATHPLFDLTGVNAAQGQTGTVWFLGSTFGDPPVVSRSITVPAGTSLFFPLINFEEDSAFAPDMSVAEMQSEISDFAGLVTALNLVVDGVAMPDLYMLRAKSPAAFSVQVPASDSVHSSFGVDAGTTVSTVVSDGYWAFIDALPPGIHTIQFGGTQGSGADAFTVAATYSINVTPAN